MTEELDQQSPLSAPQAEANANGADETDTSASPDEAVKAPSADEPTADDLVAEADDGTAESSDPSANEVAAGDAVSGEDSTAVEDEAPAVEPADAIEEPQPLDEAEDEQGDTSDDSPAETVSLAQETEDDASENDDDEDAEMEPVESLGREETLQAIHALLFASDRPLNGERLAEALGDIDRDVVTTLVGELRAFIEGQNVPYVLREIAGGYQLVTKPEYGAFIRRLYQIKKSNRLSKSVLETLAIIAYKQPVTRPAVEAIRGVSVSHAFDILQEKKLIKVTGVAELPGRPKLYRTTDDFLMHFGLESLKELPSIEEIREMGY